MKNKTLEQNNTTPEYITAQEYSCLPRGEREMWQAVPKNHEKLPLFSRITLSAAAICLIIYIAAVISPSFADMFNTHIGHVFRLLLAKISGLLPFSIAEMMLICILPLTVFYIIFAMKYRSSTWKQVVSCLSIPVGILALMFSLFVLNLGTGYRTPTLDKKLSYENTEVTNESLYQAAQYMTQNINNLSQELEYDSDGFSKMPYSFNEMNDKLLDAYDRFCEDNSIISTFDSTLKPVMLSKPMSYLHTLGIYTFFTGEANININFPDYTIPYTAAHELAHQRGIAREDEANMIAFLVCMYSDDAYIRYSAYLNMYEYIVAALASADRDMYNNVRAELNVRTSGEQYAYRKFFEEYSSSHVGAASSTINDTYLKLQGTEGEISYQLVVRLTLAYLRSNSLIE